MTRRSWIAEITFFGVINEMVETGKAKVANFKIITALHAIKISMVTRRNCFIHGIHS